MTRVGLHASLRRACRLFIWLLLVLFAVIPSGGAVACAFHLFTELPEAPLSQQLSSSQSIVALRPNPEDPFRFVPHHVLRGTPVTDAPPHLVDSVTRRRLEAASDRAVVFSRDADGTWTRLIFLDETTAPIVSRMLAETERWSAPDGAAARRDFAASLLTHPDSRLRQIALRELDSLDYGTLRAGSYDVSAAGLLAGIAQQQEQAFAPIRVQLLGLVGGSMAEEEVTRRLQGYATSGVVQGLGVWTTAALELFGARAIADLEGLIEQRDSPLSREQIDEIVQALAVQSASGDTDLRGSARFALLRFVNRYPDASFVARSQALVSSVFTGAMSDMKSGASLASAMFAVVIAFLYGAFHTLGPGHGKAVVISYFVGTGGSVRRGLLMGVQIAVTHVLSAIVIVFLFDFAVRQATGNAPSDYRMIRQVSYAAIAMIGAFMLWRAIRAMIEFKRHSHNHAHDDHDHHHHHTGGCASCEAAAKQVGNGSGWLATAVGVVPCTGALLVMLYGLANDLVGQAVVMVVAISVGMAVAMAAIGLTAIWGHNFAAARWSSNAVNRMKFTLGAQLAGALAVFLIGATLFVATHSSTVPGPGAIVDGTRKRGGQIAQAQEAVYETVSEDAALSEREGL